MIRGYHVKEYIKLMASYGTHRDIGVTDESISMLDELYKLTKILHPVDAYRNGEDRSLWLFEEDFMFGYSWFHLYLAEHKGHRGVWLNNSFIIDTKNNGYEKLDASLLLEWLIFHVKECINMIKDGTYFSFLQMNLPFVHRTGYILQKDYWKYMPKDFERTYGVIEKDHKELFIKSVKERRKTKAYTKISASDYFRDCVKILELFGEEISAEQTVKENFFRYYYGSLAWLHDMDEHDTEAFEEWITNGPADHQFDFCFTKYVVRILNDKQGFSYRIYTDRESELVPCVLSATELGLPIRFSEYDRIAEELLGECLVQIVPRNAGSSEADWIDSEDGHRVSYSRCLPENPDKELIDSIKWTNIRNKYRLDKDMIQVSVFKRWSISLSKENWNYLCKNYFKTDQPTAQRIQDELKHGMGIAEYNWYKYYKRASAMFSDYIESLQIDGG